MTTTITIEVDKRTKSGKAFLAMLDTFLKDQAGIKVLEGNSEVEKTVKKEATEAEIMKLSKEINRSLRLRLDKEYSE